MYGKHWLDLWANIPTQQVMATWEDALRGVKGEQIRKALDHLTANNPFPPTCPEFVGICQQFRSAPERAAYLALPNNVRDPMPRDIAAEIAKLSDANRKQDPKDWARKILAETRAGTYRLPIGIQYAREALGVAADFEVIE